MHRLYLVAWVGSLTVGCCIWKIGGDLVAGVTVIVAGLVAGILLMLVCGHKG